MTNRWTQLLTAWVFVLGSMFTQGALAQTTVQATGQGVVYGSDKAAARDRALDDARRKAVEKAVGAIVSSQTVTENYQLLSDQILSKSHGFVRKHTIIKEGVHDGIYEMTIEAEVSAEVLNNALNDVLAVLQARDMPRIILMISEQQVGSSEAASWWSGEGSYSIDLGVTENGFMRALMDKGFEFVDRQALGGKITSANGVSKVGMNPELVKTIGTDADAEVAIYGTAMANDVGSVMGTALRSARAKVSLKALNLDNGRVLATTMITKGSAHVDVATAGTRALQSAAKAAAEDLLAQIMKRWTRETAGPAIINVTIKGVTKSKYLREISSFLGNQVRGVQKVRQRSYRHRVVQLELSLKGTAQNLAEMLEEKSFGAFAFEIDGISKNTITAHLTAKKK